MPGTSGDTAKIDGIIAQAYECLFEPAGWNRVLTSFAQLVGGESALIYIKSRTAGAGVLRTSSGFDPHYDLERYSSYYEARSPLIARYRSSRTGHVTALGDYAFSPEYRETEYFRDWVRPQRFADMLGSHLARTQSLYAWLSIRRAHERGVYANPAIRAANRLGPHLGRAIQLGAELERQRGLANGAFQSLEMMGVGVMIVDANARLMTSNSAADALLRIGDGLRSSAGRLCCDRTRDSNALQIAIAAVARTPGADPAVATDLCVSRSRAGSPLTVHVLPIAAVPANLGLAPCAAAAVFAIDPEARIANVDGFAAAYGLTGAERGVLREIVRCGGLVATARKLGVGLPTARTHLQHIFQKTGAGNQAELVARVMCIPVRPRS